MAIDSLPIALPLLRDLSTTAVLDSLADGVYITDRSSRIVFWNRAAERIVAWRSEDVVGRCCSDNILVHVDQDGHPLCGHGHCPLLRSMVTGRPSAEPLLLFAQTKSGTRTPVEVSVSPLRDDAGRIVGGIEVFRDVNHAMQDLLRARAIQTAALRSPPADDGRIELEVCYQPHGLVGGDFYRVERLDADRYALFVADVMGHGVAAAMYALQLGGMWDELRAELSSPASFLRGLNQRLHPLVRQCGYFATAAMAVYDASCGECRCARAGHPAPLLFRSGGVERVGPSRPALGVFPDQVYEESSVTLAAGETVLMFSDGAVELIDLANQGLGIDGLMELVGGHRCEGPEPCFRVARLEEELLRYSGGIRLPDDLTLVKLRRIG